jgi:hypothetical protein
MNGRTISGNIAKGNGGVYAREAFQNVTSGRLEFIGTGTQRDLSIPNIILPEEVYKKTQ